MTDMDSHGADLRVDLLIDRVVARRAAGPAGDPAPGPLSPDEALVTELARLDEIDWPADETGDRIAMRVAAAAGPRAAGPRAAGPRAAGPDAVTGAVASPGQRATPQPARSGRRRWLAAGVAAAALALALVGVVQLTGAGHSPRPSSAPGSASRVRATSPTTKHRAAPPTWLTAMRVVSQAAALSTIGAANSNDNFLTCVTSSVCYTLGSLSGNHSDIAHTIDGGATWTSGAPLPADDGQFDSQAAVSCPQAMTCFLPWGTDVLETDDGFAHFQAVPVSTPASPSGLVSAVSCPTTRHCVVQFFSSGNRPAFAYSDDGGASWTSASSPAISTTDVIGGLRCDPDGACITAIIAGGAGNPTVAAVTSTDGGRTWNMSAAASIVSMQQYMVSCGSGSNCVVGSNDGYLAWLNAAAGGHVGVRVQTLPGSWGPALSAVSCATGSDCFMVAGNLLQATHDQGLTWTSTPLTAPGVTQGHVVYFSCPAPAGCIALANDGSGDTSSWAVLSNLGDRATRRHS
jgi:hypothetical protein